ncbi:MAG: hypothetical protein U9Q90_11160 [Campylobacterota bacterium]|nr:hypothetical protein [Campylobacterota bacterium]
MKVIAESILDNAKKAYKESVVIGSIEIQELLLSILTDTIRLQESVESSANKPGEGILSEDTQPRDINIIAYVFSEYEHTSLFPNKSQTNAVKYVSQLLNVKYNTFKNKRDAFDRYTNSKRKGRDKELPKPLQRIFDEYKNLPWEQAMENANVIINNYKETDSHQNII